MQDIDLFSFLFIFYSDRVEPLEKEIRIQNPIHVKLIWGKKKIQSNHWSSREGLMTKDCIFQDVLKTSPLIQYLY